MGANPGRIFPESPEEIITGAFGEKGRARAERVEGSPVGATEGAGGQAISLVWRQFP